MKREKQRGITLIALVITIIVLLILAAISIATLTGQNGILNQADNAKKETERETAKEKVALEVLGSYGEDGSIDIRTLNKNLENVKGLTSGLPITYLPATVTVDGYNIKISEKGEVSIEEENNETPPVQEQPITNLKIGDKVQYIDKNNNKINCVVLYDNTTSYGIQIISEDIVDTLKLGDDNNYDVSMESYNNSLNILNNKANDYLNPVYASATRSVGSPPDMANMDSYEEDYMDYDQMSKSELNIANIGKEYWYAGRINDKAAGTNYYSVYSINSSGNMSYTYICKYASLRI